jgi:tetratricopeptide (TPR) repeat protein
MTGSRSNVVPFERPAAYWAVRARKHYSPRKLPDAARLMRKALEKSGDPGLALELSEIYSGMECYTAAERCLLRSAVRQGLTGSLCFAVGCCALNRGDEDLAERALDQSLRLEPDGVFSERAQDILEYYPWQWNSPRPHCARGEELCRRSFRAAGTPEAVELARKAWRRGHAPRAALWLGMLLPPKEGKKYLARAAEQLPDDLRAHLYFAGACAETRDWPKARRQLQLARQYCRTITDAELFCIVAWEMGKPKTALNLVNEKLMHSPASVDYLRLKYLTLLRMPGEESQAGRALETLLEIDPDDADGLYYRRHPEEKHMNSVRSVMLSVLGGMVYALPERLRYGRLNRMLHLITVSLNGMADTEVIYRLLPGLYARLTEAEKYSADEYRTAPITVALAMALLLRVGNGVEAIRLYKSSPGKKRIMRLLKRLMKKSSEFRVQSSD